ncbi:MAG TPA: alpha/beta fold hydrolase [Opitutaceae bacterium]
MRSNGVLAGLLAVALSSAGCINARLTRAIVEAPNGRHTPRILTPARSKELLKDDATYSEAWMVPVGPPAAQLSVAVVEPGDYKSSVVIRTGKFKNGREPVWPETHWTIPARPPGAAVPPRATVLLLHGYEDSKEDMMHWALFLAEHRYRAVLVDLRGHGRSTGSWIGYGAFEAHDLQQVIDDLDRRHLIAGRLGVLGISYGASVGLQLAGRDRRVGAVVAMEPFSDSREAVVEFARAVVPKLVSSWTERDFSTAEDRAARLGGFAWSSADPAGSAASAQAPILYVCADNDHWISPGNTRRLADRTRSLHSVVTVHFDKTGLEDHILLSWVLNPMAPAVLSWLNECLSDPAPALPGRLAALGFIPSARPASTP